MPHLFHIQAVCDPIQEWADHEARRLGCVSAAGPTELLENDDVDALILLEALWYRLWPLELACRLGKPVFSAALPDAGDAHVDDLLHQVKERRLPVLVAQSRMAPAADRLRQLLDGPLGPARLVSCDWTQPSRAQSASAGDVLLSWCAELLGTEPTRVLSGEVPSAGLASHLLEFTDSRALHFTRRRVAVARGSVRLRIVAERGQATVVSPRRLCWSNAEGRHSLTLPRPEPLARKLLERFHAVVTDNQAAEPDLAQAARPLPWLRALCAAGRKDGGSKLRKGSMRRG